MGSGRLIGKACGLWGKTASRNFISFFEDVIITAVNEAGSSDLFRWEWFTNNSGIFKDWSVGQDAYKYAKQGGNFRKYIHPEGYTTKHETMTKERIDYQYDSNMFLNRK